MPISGVRLIQEIGTVLDAVAHDERLQSGFGIDRKTRLLQLQFFDDFLTNQLEVVCHIGETAQENQLSQQMKAPVRHDLLKWIVQQDAVS